MNDDVILLAHGSGGKLSHDLVERLFVRHFDNPTLLQLDDSAVLGASPAPSGLLQSSLRLAFSTDSYVVSPLFFPGGDIGKLAVCGTVNDLSMSGARPLWLSAGFIIEEGLPLAELERVVASMAATARQAGVQIVTGDTKVVDRGSADRLFINTAGVGLVPPGVEIAGDRARPGDVVLLSGTIGDHGMTIMTQREGLKFDSPLESDCAPLNGLVAVLLDALPAGRHPLPARSHAGRAGDHPQRVGGPVRCWHRDRRNGGAGARGGARRLRAAGPRSPLRGQRGQADRHRGPGSGRGGTCGTPRPRIWARCGHHWPGDRGPPPARRAAHGLGCPPCRGHAGRRATSRASAEQSAEIEERACPRASGRCCGASPLGFLSTLDRQTVPVDNPPHLH